MAALKISREEQGRVFLKHNQHQPGCIHISRSDGSGETAWKRHSPTLDAALGS